jgi:hypothetical protein
MGASVVGKKLTSRVKRETGLDIVRVWGHGDYAFPFVTAAHEHGVWDKKTGAWEWQRNPTHYTSCRELFGEGK